MHDFDLPFASYSAPFLADASSHLILPVCTLLNVTSLCVDAVCMGFCSGLVVSSESEALNSPGILFSLQIIVSPFPPLPPFRCR